MKDKLDRLKIWFKKAAKETGYFLSSGIFLKNFGGVVALITFTTIATFWWMDCYTRHGQALHVADYVGMPIEDVIEQATSNSFEIVINDSTFIPQREPGTVLAQDPKPHSTVKKNRKIYVSITKVIPDMATLPDLRGGNDDYDNFSKKCKRSYIDTEVSKEVFSSKLERNTILEVYYNGEEITDKLSEGYEVPKGSTVQCVVTKRGGGSVPVPELVCKKYSEATFLVSNISLNVGSVIADNTVTNERSAYVWKQTPRYSPSGRMRVGEQIDIYLTQFRPASCANGAGNIEAPAPVEEDEEF